MNNRKIVVYDLETTSKNPLKADPVEIAAMVIDPFSLKLVPDSQFEIKLQPTPESIDVDTLEWHAKKDGLTTQEVRDKWNTYIPQKQGWQQFCSYLDKYHTNFERSDWTAPIPAGFNIVNFDNIIVRRLADKYKNSYLFNKVHKLDLFDMLFQWFEGRKEIKKYNFDYYRDFFGLSHAGAHSAIVDVEQTSQLIIKVMKLHRSVGAKVQFKDSCAHVDSTQ